MKLLPVSLLLSTLACLINAQVDAVNELNVTISNTVVADKQTIVAFNTDAALSVLNQTVIVYLYTTVSNWPVCNMTTTFNLSNAQPITIPSTVGPSGAYYRLSMAPNGNGLFSGGWPFSVPVYSNVFFLSGGTSSWSPYEVPPPSGSVPFSTLFSQYLFNAGADIPCSSYNCARQCSTKQVPDANAWINGSVWLQCLTKCPGVTLKPISGDIGVANTTTPPLTTPTGKCDASDGQDTPCGTKCCSKGMYCLLWRDCQDMEQVKDPGASGTPSSAGPNATNANPSNALRRWTGGSVVYTILSAVVALTLECFLLDERLYYKTLRINARA